MEEDYPRTLLKFKWRFGTEQACREYRMPPGKDTVVATLTS